MERGWWRFYRKMLSDPLWEAGRERTKFEAWISLLSRAKGRPGRELVGHSMIPLERGQLIFSIHGLAKDWSWGRGKVRRFLESLEREGRISVNRGCSEGVSKPYPPATPPYSVITICKYDEYNPLKKETDHQTDQQRTSSGPAADPSNKEIKKEGTYGAEIREIIDHLNSITRASFKPTTKETIRLLTGRLSEGYTVEDCKLVVRHRWEAWEHDTKMRQFIRPGTLFLPAKFESYIQEARRSSTEEEWPELPDGAGFSPS